MSISSAQAQAYRDAFKNEFQAYKRAEEMKHEIKQLRQNLTLMRKNKVVINATPVKNSSKGFMHKRNATSLSAGRNTRRIQLKSVDKVEDYYESSPKLRDNKDTSVVQDFGLTLPEIRRSSPTKRAISAQNVDRSGPDAESDFNNTLQPLIRDEIEDKPATAGQKRKQNKEFTVKVIKNYTYDSEAKQKEMREKEEEEEKEREERQRATKVLMDHGVTQSNILQVSRRAAFERKLSSSSVSGIHNMIEGYETEIKEFKHRLELLEQKEVQRLAEETAKREELFNNHGKSKSYFLVPNLATRARSNSRRFRQLTAQNDEDKAEVERKEREKARSIGRNSRFALNSSHENLKKMIEKREGELAKLIEEHKANVKTKFVEERRQSRRSSKLLIAGNGSDGEDSARRLRARLVKKGSVEEVELDLSAIKANKRQRRNSISPRSKGSSSRRSSGRGSNRYLGGHSSKNSSGVKEINSFSEQLKQYRESSKERETDDETDKMDSREDMPLIKEVSELQTPTPEDAERAKNNKERKSLLLTVDQPKPSTDAQKKRPALSPLRVMNKYDSKLRKSSAQPRGQILRPDQIVLSHDYTTTDPFSLRVDQRCGEKKGSVYKRNQEEYLRQLKDSFRTKSGSRAQERLAQFRQNEKVSNTNVIQTLNMHHQRNNKLEPMGLACDREGRSAAMANRSNRSQHSSNKRSKSNASSN